LSANPSRVFPRVDPEEETDVAGFIPSVETSRLGEVIVPAQHDALKTDLAAELNHLVQSAGSVII
jgi:hypothetical protein